jgi:hypothetical protein
MEKQIKKTTILMLICFVATLHGFSQLTLEKTFSGTRMDMGIAKLEVSGDKYYIAQVSDGGKKLTISLFHSDFSLMKKVDLTSNDFIENSNMYIFLWSGYIHLSEKLFDDDIGIEILAEIGIAGKS